MVAGCAEAWTPGTEVQVVKEPLGRKGAWEGSVGLGRKKSRVADNVF